MAKRESARVAPHKNYVDSKRKGSEERQDVAAIDGVESRGEHEKINPRQAEQCAGDRRAAQSKAMNHLDKGHENDSKASDKRRLGRGGVEQPGGLAQVAGEKKDTQDEAGPSARRSTSPRLMTKKSRTPASVKRTATNGSGEASLSAPLTTTKVEPQMRVTSTRRISALARVLNRDMSRGLVCSGGFSPPVRGGVKPPLHQELG